MSQTSIMGRDAAEIRAKFLKLSQKAEYLGLTGDQLGCLPSVKSLRAPRRCWTNVYQKTRQWICKHAIPMSAAIVVSAALLVAIVIADWPMSKRAVLEKWYSWHHLDLESEPCLIEGRDSLVDYTRPPVDCKMCIGIREVERVSNIKPEQFEAKYAYSGRPVIITDGTKSWSAIDTFSFDFFKSIYPKDSPALLNIEQNCQFFPYKTSFQTLGEVFNMSTDRAQMKDGSQPWYIGWSNCDPSATNILRQHYNRPYFLPQVAESSKTDWIFMGSPGYGAHMHIDNVINPSWQAQITGSKKWVLEPPPECYLQCEPHIEVIVNPGEIIVVDTNRWYHSTLVVSNEMSITIGSEYD